MNFSEHTEKLWSDSKDARDKIENDLPGITETDEVERKYFELGVREMAKSLYVPVKPEDVEDQSSYMIRLKTGEWIDADYLDAIPGFWWYTFDPEHDEDPVENSVKLFDVAEIRRFIQPKPSELF